MAGKRILITGSTGFLGSAVTRALRARNSDQVYETPGRKLCDLRNPQHVQRLFTETEPTHVIHCAYPGTDGIASMLKTPATITQDLLRMDLNVLEAAAVHDVQRFIAIGSACAYPEVVGFPTAEHELWNGAPEPVNRPYGVAKRMLQVMLEAWEREASLPYSYLILSNLYGPGYPSQHVIQATIRKCLEAKAWGSDSITIWGTGKASREFLYIDDAARAVLAALDTPVAEPGPINICSGEEVTIWQLVDLIKAYTHYQGEILWDPRKPDGQARRWFSNVRAAQLLNWQPHLPFLDGLRYTVDWYTEHGPWERP